MILQHRRPGPRRSGRNPANARQYNLSPREFEWLKNTTGQPATRCPELGRRSATWTTTRDAGVQAMPRQTKPIHPPKNWRVLKAHPLAELVDFGAGIDLAALTKHIREHGYDENEPVVLHEGQILD